MTNPKSGDVYFAYRSDIDPPHNKYQLYFDEKTVLLINTKENKSSVNVTLYKKDCSILEYDSNICIDNVFCYEKNTKVIKATEIPSETLIRLKELVSMSNLLTGKQIKHIEKAIALILDKRNLY